MNTPRIHYRFSRPSTPVTADPPSVDVLLSISVPVILGPRPPLNLALVLDCSGSMAGRSLQLAKRAAQQAVRLLTPQDRVSVVTFDSHARVLVPGTAVTEPEALVEIIAGIRSGGSTALHDGWATGLQEVRPASDFYPLNRVLVLTDGFANVGLRTPDALAIQVSLGLSQGVSTSVIGLGNHYNEVLLETLATAGDGNYTYVEDPSQLEAVFHAELAGMRATAGQRVSLGLEGTGGARVLEVYNDLQRMPNGRLRLPNLLLGQPLQVATRICSESHAGAGVHLRLAWNDVTTGERQVQWEDVNLPHPDGLPLDTDVASVVTALQVARLKEGAISAAERGDVVGAERQWDQISGMIRSGISDGLTLDAEARGLQQVRDRLERGDHASASKLARSQNYARRQSKRGPG